VINPVAEIQTGTERIKTSEIGKKKNPGCCRVPEELRITKKNPEYAVAAK